MLNKRPGSEKGTGSWAWSLNQQQQGKMEMTNIFTLLGWWGSSIQWVLREKTKVALQGFMLTVDKGGRKRQSGENFEIGE